MTEKKTLKDVEKLTFEEALAELEEIVRKLEDGKAPLNDAIFYYERGSSLKTYCEQKLSHAKMRIEQIVVNPSGQVSLETKEFI